jgi:protein farnesyltransferase/geranylgeranyltransferase type-1 subunit alpha
LYLDDRWSRKARQLIYTIDPTIAAQREAEYLASRPYQVLKDTKGLSRMTTAEKTAYATYRFLDTGAWQHWNETQQKEFWKAVEQQKIPTPLPKPKDLGKDFRGRDIGTYTPEEYKVYERSLRDIQRLSADSERFSERRDQLGKDRAGEEKDVRFDEERNRRKLLGHLTRKQMGKYEGDPVWDDVIPMPQDDGEGALAQIAYTDEYAEGRLSKSSKIR